MVHVQRAYRFGIYVLVGCCCLAGWSSASFGKGEPAENFIKRLRAGKYFDLAITYLDRLEKYPGVNKKILSAIDLEKAQTYIDAAISSGTSKDRDAYFLKAQGSLSEFLKNKDHERITEAQMQLGKLQMVRSAQLLIGDPDEEAKAGARASLTSASDTFDLVITDLKAKLTEMRKVQIDKKKEPEKAALRDLYQFHYLEAQVNSAETRLQAAMTFDDPAKDGKELLQEAETRFSDLSKKYSKYLHGAKALLHLGDIYTLLGEKDKALDSYLRMLEGAENDDLRDAKYKAAAGLIDLRMSAEPPEFQKAIDRTAGMVKTLRLNEKRLPSVQRLRVSLAKAYLTKSKNKELKPTEIKRAESDGRQLLVAASKIGGEHRAEAKELLSSMGIESEETAALPTAEPPKSIDDALEKTGKLLEASENIRQSLTLLQQQEQTPALQQQIKDLESEIDKTRVVGIQILRGGLAMANLRSDRKKLNQLRQYLAFLVFQRKDYRDAAVVGEFLARNAPGTELGLRGGLISLNSLQLLLNEVPESDNEGLMAKLDTLSSYLVSTWPNDPKAAAGETMRIRLLLQKDRFDEARDLINKLKDGPEKSSLLRLLGQLLWNQSISLRRSEDAAGANKALKNGLDDLKRGLDGIAGALVNPDALQAALVLTKMHRKLGDETNALATLDNEKYGPIPLVAKIGAPNPNFKGDLYATELKALVGVMIAKEGDIDPLMKRTDATMTNLRAAFQGPDADKKLTATYRLLASDVKKELDAAGPAKKTKLISVFRLLLERIAGSTNDKSTLLWVAQTLVDMGKAAMPANAVKASVDPAKALLTTAKSTFERVLAGSTLATQFQYANCNRLLGNYTDALDTLEDILSQKPTMLDAQKEGALCYEYYAGESEPKRAVKIYRAAISGGRPNAKRENTIWGWGKISQLTSSKAQYQDQFFDARYHIALCRFMQGQKSKDKKMTEQAIKDVRDVEVRYPTLGGPKMRTKFDSLLKAIQKEAGQQQTGLKPLK